MAEESFTGASTDASADAFTDAELAFLRHARFGELPARVLPEDRVELAETDPVRRRLDIGPAQEQLRALSQGGA